MTAVFHEHEIEFQYPENWSLSGDESEGFPIEITLESPQGGLWVLSVFPEGSDGKSLANDVLKTLEQQYDSVESHDASSSFGSVTADGFDVSFFYLDLLVEARVRYFTIENRTFVILVQAEDRVFQKQSLVFDAIATSLVSNSSVPANS